MKNVSILKKFIILIIVAFSVGCKGGPYYPIQKRIDEPPMQFTDRIIMMDKNVTKALLYIDHKQYRLESGQLLVRVNLQNRFPDTDLWADVKIVFYDQANMRLDETAWNRTLFPALEVTMIEGNSIRSDADNYSVLIKNLRSTTGRRLKPAPPPR